MEHLWNTVRLQKHWGRDEVVAIETCLHGQITFNGLDWEKAAPAEIEAGAQYIQTIHLFAEHLLIGGTIDSVELERIKTKLVEDLKHPSRYVRGNAASGLLQVNALGDRALLERLRAMNHDPDDYVRSVIKVHFEDLKRQGKIKE